MRIYRGFKAPKPINIKPKGLPRAKRSRNFGARAVVLKLIEGPLDGIVLDLHHRGGTLPITMHGCSGRYLDSGKWLPA